MIAEELTNQVVRMSPEERKELSNLLLKIELENDSELWETLRARMADPNPNRLIAVEDIPW